MRCRQILIKHAGSKRATNVERKPVTRSLDVAMGLALSTLRKLSDGDAFVPLCRQISECPSKLKGGEMAGDVGWLDREKGADVVQDPTGASTAPILAATVIAAAFALKQDETSDLVISEEGIHILQRTA